jgi:rare lipoprotein A
MQGASKVRANIGARTLTGMTIIAVVFVAGGVQRSWADPPAPIVYTKALADQNAPISFDEFQGRSASLNSAPIDLRPGAVQASFGPALPPVSRLEQPRALTSAPMAWAEPYAGPPYQVEGKWYVPTYEPNYDEVGIASWYGPTFHGKDAASGEQFDENAMTAAHPTLPIPSLVRVTNLENGKSVIVRLNDRGPFVDDRIIDLSKKAGQALDMHAKGTAKVRVQYVGPAPAAPNSLPVQSREVQTMPVPATPVQAAVPAIQPVIATQPASEPPPSFVSKPLTPVTPVQLPRAPQVQDQRGYFLQAGSFADLGNAHAFRDKLQNLGAVSVTAVQINGAEFYRVMVGPWTSRAEAVRAQGRLIEAGAKAIVVARLD